MRFCVPVFLMVTGVLILGSEIHLKEFLKKKFLRIIYPFLFWNSIYIVYNYLTGHIPVNLYMLKWAGDKFLHGASFHLWYVYLIIGIHLFIPVMNKWTKHSNLNEILFFLCLWSITLSFNLFFLKEFKPSIELSYFAGYLGYVILGYYLFQKEFNPGLFKSFLIFIIGVFLTATGTFYLSYKKGSFSTHFYEYLTPNVALTSIGMFLMIRNMKIENSILRKMLFYLSKHSLGVYLMHIFIFKLLLISGIDWEILAVPLRISLQTFLCLLISGLFIFLLRRIPYGKYIAG